MADEKIIAHNRARWNDLAAARFLCTRAKTNRTAEQLRAQFENDAFLGSVAGRDVLCLAGGGGFQSAAFALLGARVTVADFCAAQLEQDHIAARHFGVTIQTIQADMRDLAVLKNRSFDLVHQPYSINYVPSVTPVFDEVARVLRPGGLYSFQFHNPFRSGAWLGSTWNDEIAPERLWLGVGYPLRYPYREGSRLEPERTHWDIHDADGTVRKVEAPWEYLHTLGAVLNGLIQHGLAIEGVREELADDPNAKPGTWDHFVAISPPWITVGARKIPSPR